MPPAAGGKSLSATKTPTDTTTASQSTARAAAFANTQVSVSDSGTGGPSMPIPAVESVTIRWKEPENAGTTPPARTNTTNAPLDMQPSATDASLERIVALLQQQLESNKDFAAEWRLRMVQLALDRDADAANVSANLPDDSRTLLTAIVGSAAAARNMMRNPMLTGEEALQQVAALRHALSIRADPTVSAIALCRKVITFGSYEEMAREDFVSGRAIQTIVYSEIRNLKSERNAEGLFETRLSTRLEALTADGKSVWQQVEAEIIDHCRRHREDFFIAQRVTFPPTLPAGEYVLKVLVEDKLSGKVGEASQGFTLHSPVSVAKGPTNGR